MGSRASILHLPTDVDALASLALTGADVRVYHEDIPTFSDSGRKDPASLLHTKMLLFWSKDKTAELWVGSHNWTNRALLGLNVEASLVVRMLDTSPLFRAAAGYLEMMRRISEPFDLAKVDVYKEVQRKSGIGLTPVIELSASNGEALDGATIALFGTEREEFAPLDTIGRHVHVALVDPESREQSLYRAEILHSGLLAASDAGAGGISFSSRRYAFQRGSDVPSLQSERAVDQHILDAARYFVTLRLGRREAALIAELPTPRRVVMREVSEAMSPLIRRLSPSARERLFRGRAPRLRKAVAASLADSSAQATAQQSEGPRLLAMRVLRPKSVTA